MAKNSVGKQAETRTAATAERAGGQEVDRRYVGPEESVQRLARDGRPGAGDVTNVALALQRIAGNRSTARMLGSRGGRRSVGEVARSGFEGGSSGLPFMSRIQELFGSHDISGVRSFTGPGPAAASRALSARAYASGDKVVFAESSPSLHTVAHEAAHVVQQRAGIHLPGGLGAVGDAHERHADAVADRVVRGESAQGSLDTYFPGRAGGAATPAGGGMGVQRLFGKPLATDVEDKPVVEMDSDEVPDSFANVEKRYDFLLGQLVNAIKEVNEKKENGPKLMFNPDADVLPMLHRLEYNDGDYTYKTYEHLIEALKTRGAILIDGKESGKPAPHVSEKFVINLLLPGSGDRRWRTFAENMIDTGVPTRSEQYEKMQEIKGDDKDKRTQLGIASGDYVYPTLYEDLSEKDTEVTYMIRGPGMTNKTSTHPSNSIGENLETTKAIVDSYLKTRAQEQVKVRIMGHSRNGVVAARLISNLRNAYPDLETDAVIFDPVPGADANIANNYNEEKLPNEEFADQDLNSTVIFSLMDNRWGFNPMQVYGAKRLILTHYSHHAGIESGFIYNKEHYKGLGLIDLPEGLFFDIKAPSPGKPNVLSGPTKDWNDLTTLFMLAQQERDDKNKNRIARIRKVVEEFLGTKAKEYTNEDFEQG